VAENRLLDTDVLVYAYDASETRRRAIANSYDIRLLKGE
jgi:hypothetical protein